MRLPRFTSFIDARLLTLLAIIYAIAAGVQIGKTTRSASYNREIFPEFMTEPLEGARVVDYAFSASHSALKGLWVFFELPPGAASEGRLVLSMRHAEASTPFWSQSFACKRADFLAPGYLCRIE